MSKLDLDALMSQSNRPKLNATLLSNREMNDNE